MERLRHFRKQARLTQAKLADLAGVDQAYISRIEAGMQKPSLDVTYALANALGISPGDLFPRMGLERDLMEAFEAIPPEHRPAAIELLRTLARTLPQKA